MGQQNQREAETSGELGVTVVPSGWLGVTVVPSGGLGVTASGVLGVTAVPWNSEHRVSHEQDAPKQQGSTRRHGRDRRLGAATRLAGANAAEDLVAVRSEQGEAVGADRGGVLGAVDEVGLALSLTLVAREGGLPLVDALHVTCGRREVTGSMQIPSPTRV